MAKVRRRRVSAAKGEDDKKNYSARAARWALKPSIVPKASEKIGWPSVYDLGWLLSTKTRNGTTEKPRNGKTVASGV